MTPGLQSSPARPYNQTHAAAIIFSQVSPPNITTLGTFTNNAGQLRVPSKYAFDRGHGKELFPDQFCLSKTSSVSDFSAGCPPLPSQRSRGAPSFAIFLAMGG